MLKRSKVSFEPGFGTCRDIDEEKPLHEKVLFLCKFPFIERHALRLKWLSCSVPESSFAPPKWKYATSCTHGQWCGGRQSNHCLQRIWGGLLQEILMGCFGFWVIPVTCSCSNFCCNFLMFVFFGKCGYQQTFQGLKHALSWNIEPPTSSQNCNSDWIKTRIIMQHHKRLLVTSSHCGACSIDSIAWAQRDPCHQVAHC